MSTRDKRVDAYIAKSADFAKPILNHLRELVHQACPEVQETIKWGFPHFDYKGMLCSMASFKKHCAFGFWKAKLMADFDEVLSPVGETAMGHFGRITSLKDLPADTRMRKYIKEACKLNDAGAKVERPKRVIAKKPITVPAYFRKELAKNPLARATFDKFSHSHKKDYVEWITEARTDATRMKRMSTALEWLAEGKSRNWKYER